MQYVEIVGNLPPLKREELVRRCDPGEFGQIAHKYDKLVPQVQRDLPGFRTATAAPPAKVKESIIRRKLWNSNEVAVHLLKSFWNQNAKLIDAVQRALLASGMDPVPPPFSEADVPQQAMDPGNMRIEVSDQERFFFAPGGKDLEGFDPVEVTLAAVLFGWSKRWEESAQETVGTSDAQPDRTTYVIHRLKAKQAELESLLARLAKLSRDLTGAGAEAADQRLPSRQLAEKINGLQKDFEDFYAGLIDLSAPILGDEGPGERSLRQAEILLGRAIEALSAEVTASSDRDRALKVLDACGNVRHKEDPQFAGLRTYRELLARVLLTVRKAARPPLPQEIGEVLSGVHPLVLVLDLIGSKPPSGSTDPRLKLVQTAFGIDLQNAILLKELAPTTAPVNPEPPTRPKEGKQQPFRESQGYAQPAETGHEVVNPSPETSAPPLAPESNPGLSRPVTSSRVVAADMLRQPDSTGALFPDLVWALLHEGHVDVALQIVRASVRLGWAAKGLPPSWLMEALVLAPHAVVNAGSSMVADALKSAFDRFSEDFLIEGDETQTLAKGMLGVAASLQPALLSPWTGAYSVLSACQLFVAPRLPIVSEIARVVEAFSQFHFGFDLESAKGKAFREERLHHVMKEAQAWLERAPVFNISYGPAKTMWRHWVSASGPLYRMLFIVTEANKAARAEVEALAKQFGGDIAIKVEVQRGQKELRCPPIEARALRQLVDHGREASAIATKWLELCAEGGVQKDDFSRKQSEATGIRVKQLLQPGREELMTFERGNGPFSAATILTLKALDGLEALLSTTIAPPSHDGNPTALLNRCLLHFPGLTPDSDLSELEPRSILTRIETGDWTWETSFASQIAAANFLATGQIIDVLRSDGLDDKRLRSIVQKESDARADALDGLQRRADFVRRRIEDAVASNLLRESERSALLGQLPEDTEGTARLLEVGEAFRRLSGIEAEIDKRFETGKEEMLKRLSDLSLPTDLKDKVAKLIKSSDLVTAEEYLDRSSLKRGISDLDGPRTALDRFFPAASEALNVSLEHGYHEVIELVRNREDVAGVSLKHLTGAHAKRYAEALDLWMGIKHSKAADPDTLRRMLEQMGFPPITGIKTVQGAQVLYTIATKEMGDREVCPVPQFGSLAEGRYRIVCALDRLDEEQIISLVGDTAVEPPAIVLFFGRLTNFRRRSLLKLCMERRKTFVIIDEVLAFFLASCENWLRSLFECSLPFTFVEPYIMAPGRVPREMFYGRQAERDSVIRPDGTCFIYGGRQLGKTALMLDAQARFHDPKAGRIACWIDLRARGIGYDKGADALWETVAAELEPHGITKAKDAAGISADRLILRIREWLDHDNSRKLLLLLDEADHFLTEDGKVVPGTSGAQGFVRSARLKGLMDITARRFKVVFAGLHNVQRTTRLANHPLAHYGEPVCIGPLLDNNEWREAEKLIRVPLESIGFSIPAPLARRILALTNYYPSLIQLFCHELVKFVNANHARLFHADEIPPRVIAASHVDEAYRSEGLRKSIRDRILWTLQLDPRYEVIAYSMAFDLGSSDSELRVGMSVDRIRTHVLAWWPEGFAGRTGFEEIRILLEEMVGLGILRESAGLFSFRNQNVLRLLGTAEEITKLIDQKRERTVEYEPALSRSVHKYETIVGLAPLTGEQESRLRDARPGALVMFASQLCQPTDIDRYLTELYGKHRFVVADGFVDPESATLRNRIPPILKNLREGMNVLVIHGLGPWRFDHVIQLEAILKKAYSGKISVRGLFIADPEKTWQIVDQISTEDERYAILLRPWADQAVRIWMQEQAEYASCQDESTRTAIRGITGNWPLLMQEFHVAFIKAQRSLPTALENLNTLIGSASFALPLLKALGFTSERGERTKVLVALKEMGSATISDLVTVGDLAEKEVSKAMRWAHLMGYVDLTGSETYGLNPTVGSLLAALPHAKVE